MTERKTLNRLSTAISAVLFSGCISGLPENTKSPTPEPERTDLPPPGLLFPIQNGYITSGPHSDGLSKGERYALDFAGKRSARCPGSAPLIDVPVVASESGKVINIENKLLEPDPFHSTIEIQGENGLILGYMHLDNIAVELGENIGRGDFLGNPSCESPPGGDSTGIHLHQYLKDKDGKPLAIEGIVYEGYTVKSSAKNYDGTLVKGGDIRTADKRRCGPTIETINSCMGIRNDLTDIPPYYQFPTTPEATPKPEFSEILNPSIELPILGAQQKILSLWTETWNQNYSLSFNSEDLSDTNNANFDATTYVKVNPAISLEEWYGAEKNNLFEKQSESPLLLNFDISFEKYNSGYSTVTRYIGQMEARSINLSAIDYSHLLTDSDRNLGTSWKGQSYAGYQWRFKSLRISNSGSRPEISRWIMSSPEEDLPQFGEWQSSKQIVGLQIQNGEWILRNTLVDQPDSNPWEYVNAGRAQPTLKLPFDVRLYCDTYRRIECPKVIIPAP